ncbi:MAG: KpsF/GutQ family sugar-phosphate isomerase [Thermoleophilaceae bacterium]
MLERITLESAAEGSMPALAAQVLRQETAAIGKAADRLTGEVLEASLELLLACRSKVVILGTGKSGIAASKIASTMTSTGTAAIFLHPVDALHGDIGVVSADDCAIVISNSGESEELMAVLTHVRRRGTPVIAVLGNADSSIARRSDVVLDASVDEEACPLGLAPTASTTVAIGVGDALAAMVMKAKGFTAEDFALNHPAGQLGKRLTLRVADLMHEDTADLAVGEKESLMAVIGAIGRGGLGAVNVLDEDDRLLGIVTDGDLRRSVQERGTDGLGGVLAGDIMTSTLAVVAPDALAYDALRLMKDRPSQISVLPVVDHSERCVGLLRLQDLVRAGLR